MKKLIAVSIAAAAISALSAPTFAQAEVYLDTAPPAAPMEEVPPPRAGFVWIPGYYDSYNGAYRWNPGHWEHERHGYRWRGATWESRNGHYYYREGGWDHSPG
ncbi:MAG TPA: hypothetical protein VKR38_09580 [Usitatibacter sp.]|nr:hypothetical protein [Usitatibacter sp.]